MLLFYQSHEHVQFLQDSAPCHTARTVKQWIENNNIQLIEWPGHPRSQPNREHLE